MTSEPARKKFQDNLLKLQNMETNFTPTFPALKNAEQNLRGTMPMSNGRIYQPSGSERDAFGNLLDNPNFKAELRKLQEKYRVSGFA